MKNKNLNDLFATARGETNPRPILDAEDLRSVIHKPTRRPFVPLMLGISFILVLGGYLAGRYLLDNLNRSSDVKPLTNNEVTALPKPPHVPESGAINTQGKQTQSTTSSQEHALHRPQSKVRVAVSLRLNSQIQATDNATMMAEADDDVYVAALLADEDLFRSLSIEPTAVKEICKNLAGADSVTNCSIGSKDAQVKVCVFSNGGQDEVVFMDKPGPMPVMFTSANGRGRVVTSRYSSSVDPNKLIPVAAHGCGGNVLMWFSPTEEFVYSLPDSLGKELNGILEFDIQMNAFGKNLHFRKKLDMTDSAKHTQLMVDVDSVLGTLQTQLDSLGTALNEKFNQLKKQLHLNDSFPKKLNLEVQPDVQNRILVISCGRVDKKSVVPSTTTPLQETRTNDGVLISSTIYPNPSSNGEITIGFELKEPRLVSVNLLDLSGTTVRTWATNIWKNSGSNHGAYSLDGIPAGMYLVTLITDKNERVVQRLIVQ